MVPTARDVLVFMEMKSENNTCSGLHTAQEPTE
jgi:hypothetical protein